MNLTAESITQRLDALESELPPIPSKTLGLTRASARRTNDIVTQVVDRVGAFVGPVATTAATASKTVVGQARSAADRSAAAIRKGRNETVGQLGAQVDRTVETLRTETEDLLDDAIKATAPETIDPASLADLSKSELYDRAQALDIDGRASMNKSELVAALRSA